MHLNLNSDMSYILAFLKVETYVNQRRNDWFCRDMSDLCDQCNSTDASDLHRSGCSLRFQLPLALLIHLHLIW